MPYDGLKSAALPAYAFKHFAANNTGVALVASEAILHSVIINNAGASANIVTLYNAATAATSDTTTDIAIIDSVELNGREFVYDITCSAGIFFKMETGTAADVTVTWIDI